MSNQRRKQDEKHTKMLRDLAAVPHNKHCFDCHQRGPTYVNMTVGSFVCTGCSGILRGLNPPHRVKSISMASFSPEEIEAIKAKGNDYCKKVWLGLYDGDSRSFEVFRDEQQMKDFLNLKYEKKRWYVSPNEIVRQQAMLAQHSGGSSGSAKMNNQPKPSPTPKQNSLIDTSSPTRTTAVPRTQPQQSMQTTKSLDLFDSDPFAQQQPKPASGTNGIAFANFANFEVLNTSRSTAPPPMAQSAVGLPPPPGAAFDSQNLLAMPKSATVPASLAPVQPNVPKTAPPPSSQQQLQSDSDKYSALAELDELFGVSTNTSNAQTDSTPSWSAAPPPSAFAAQSEPVPAPAQPPPPSVFGRSPQTNHLAGGVPKSSSAITGFPQQQQHPQFGTQAQGFGPASNPFLAQQQGVPPVSAPVGWPPVRPAQPVNTANPFFGGAPPAMQPMQQQSNPFGGATAFGQPQMPAQNFAQMPPQNNFAQMPQNNAQMWPQQGAQNTNWPTQPQQQANAQNTNWPTQPQQQQANPFMGMAPPAQQQMNWNPFLS